MRATFIHLGALALVAGCPSPSATAIVSRGDTFAEMRTIKGDVTVTPPGETARPPYPRERIVDRDEVRLGAGGLAWVRRDGGAVWLVEGPAQMTFRDSSVILSEGRAFVDSEGGPPASIETPRGPIELSDARASIAILADGTEEVYVLRGSARAGRAGRGEAGDLVTLKLDGSVARAPAVAWEDWTGGLATADPAAEPAPFGIGTVGARPPGDKGKPRFSLAIERLDVRVTVDHDFAVTEVDETFANVSSNSVEGIFSFRTPSGAVLHKFGVDRNGDLVWGQIKESTAAQAQYESNVYAGSTEDPALLQWVAPGVYGARLYPIAPGAKRRVVTRYAEWLPRQGPRADRRLYVYPMAAEGARGSLPRIEELHVAFDLSRSGADRVRAGMGGRRDGDEVVVRAFDFVPRADLAVELFDGGQDELVAYRAPHTLAAEDIPVNAGADFASKVASEERDYLLVPVRARASALTSKGVDLAIVVDTSAATDRGALAVARSMSSALLAHLGPDDRVALWAGDARLRPVADGSGELGAIDPAKRRAWLEGLARVEPGGATDIGALLTEAAGRLDPKRRGAVIYIGDGQPSVGEIAPKALRERLARLPQGTRVLAAGVGVRANLALLQSVARGAPVEPVGDAYGAARTALRLLEAAQRPGLVGATPGFGPGVERVLPRELPAVGVDEGVLVVGRLSGKPPTQLTLVGDGETATVPLRIVPIDDSGDLRRRWGLGRLEELLEEGAGRAALVDIGRRFGIVSPYTSLYVPTEREAAKTDVAARGSLAELQAKAIERRAWWRPWSNAWRERSYGAEAASPRADFEADEKAGGTGTRAKGEEGAMGSPVMKESARASGVSPGQGIPAPRAAMAAPTPGTAQIGMLELLMAPAGGPNAPPPASVLDRSSQQLQDPSKAQVNRSAPSPTSGESAATASGAEGVGLFGAGGAGQGSGRGQGRLGAGHKAMTSNLREGAISVQGRLAGDVIGRIVRQNFGRFRLCYEDGRRKDPSLEGLVKVRFVIDRSGAVSFAADAGSNLPDPMVVQCVVRGFGNLSFPQPEGGTATVVYPVSFKPGEGAAVHAPPAPDLDPKASGPLAVVGHAPRPCGAAANLSLDDRRGLWAERLTVSGSASDIVGVYHRALEDCEAPTWQERTQLLLLMVDRLRTVTERVALWKMFVGTPAADVVYRAIVVRIQTVAELRELHQALGIATVDPDLLAGMLAKAKTPGDRLSVLRAAAFKWPNDLELALRVLDGYEDAGDESAGRSWARRLRRRPDATAHVWTSVGEYYLRLSARKKGAASDRDALEGRRTFGELVEFAPEDPAARRRLGDLLRAHGWYEEAFRQYETLQQLTPDDPAVPLLLAVAAQGMGRIEEAVGWAEKAAAAGSPDGASELSRSARALASAFLAWARADALVAGRTEDADKLLSRTRRLVGTEAAGQGGSVRFLLTWSHPELRPSLWTSALGAPSPAPDNFPFYGVAEARVAGSSPPPAIELHLDPDDAARAARLGAKAIVTAITGEGTADERIALLNVGFGSPAVPSGCVKVNFDDGALRVEVP
jgi:Ca-activated chloride channel family protein